MGLVADAPVADLGSALIRIAGPGMTSTRGSTKMTTDHLSCGIVARSGTAAADTIAHAVGAHAGIRP